MAQGGFLDIDGTGMRRIRDPGLAGAFLERTNVLNVGIGRDVASASIVFVLLPQGVTYPLAAWTVILTVVYVWSLIIESSE